MISGAAHRIMNQYRPFSNSHRVITFYLHFIFNRTIINTMPGRLGPVKYHPEKKQGSGNHLVQNPPSSNVVKLSSALYLTSPDFSPDHGQAPAGQIGKRHQNSLGAKNRNTPKQTHNNKRATAAVIQTVGLRLSGGKTSGGYEDGTCPA